MGRWFSCRLAPRSASQHRWCESQWEHNQGRAGGDTFPYSTLLSIQNYCEDTVLAQFTIKGGKSVEITKKHSKKKKKEYFFPFCLNCELGHFGVRQALAGDQGQEGEGSRTWQQQLLYQLSCSTNPPLTASAVSWLLTTVKPQNSWIYPLPPAPYWLGNYSGSFWDLL